MVANRVDSPFLRAWTSYGSGTPAIMYHKDVQMHLKDMVALLQADKYYSKKVLVKHLERSVYLAIEVHAICTWLTNIHLALHVIVHYFVAHTAHQLQFSGIAFKLKC